MLQYILTKSDRFAVGELAQMAVEGGCMWISLCLPELSDEELKAAVAPDVIEMCREAGVFLTLDDRPELARELGLHGVRLSRKFLNANPHQGPMALREELGPEAVIGVETADPSSVPQMLGADIDFVTLPQGFDSEQRRKFVKALTDLDVKMPVVAQGDFTPAEAQDAIKDGCNGVAVGRSITDAEDPVTATGAILFAISNL